MLALYRASQALAACQTRNYVVPEDVKKLAACVLAHRLITRADSHLRGRTTAEIITEIMNTVPVPVEELPARES